MKGNEISYNMVPHLMGFQIISVLIFGKNDEFLHFFPKMWNSSKYIFPDISPFLMIRDLKLSQKLFQTLINIM